MTKLSLLFDPRQLAGVFAAADAVFAAYILRNRRCVSIKLEGLVLASAAVGEGCEIPTSLTRDVSPVALHSLRWHPLALDQRVFRKVRFRSIGGIACNVH
jgi:hypothetical protein